MLQNLFKLGDYAPVSVLITTCGSDNTGTRPNTLESGTFRLDLLSLPRHLEG